ncbi:MAG: hypothetical protein HBSAPP03_10720 [Phycisphaerae bacterium]|nr:MAG: hypothetical protein HBSAPP03_10720 [Phycisphaerae bacterium]
MASRPAGMGANKPLVIVLLLVVCAAGVYALFTMLPTKDQPPKGDPTLTKAPNTGTPAPANNAGNTPSNVLGAQGPNASDSAAKFATPSGATPATDGTKPPPADVTQANGTPPTIKSDPTSNPPTPPAIVTPTASVMSVRAKMDAGEQAFAQGKLVEARETFSRAYLDKDCAPLDRALIREKLTAINRDLLFSPKITPGDPLVEAYTVQSGDVLDRIRKKRELTVDSKFIARINGMANPDVLKLGQKLKLVRGPFHAVVTKSEFRLDLFAGSPDEPETWTFIRSFSVGLGDGNSTPVGLFTIRNKMENPSWRNPRTGEAFSADDPKNPIGEFWLGWEGLGDSKIHTGFGVHGTIEPASIGKEMSMGCVRMATDDIAMVYEMLSERISLVRVVP